MNQRVERFRELVQKEDLDVFFVSQPENRRYLSGFTGSAGYLLITPEEALLLVDSRYTEQAAQQAPDFEVVRVGNQPLEKELPPILGRLGGRRWGLEKEHVTVGLYERLTPAFEEAGITLVGTAGLVEQLRAVKDAEELERLRRAIHLTDEAFAHFVGWVRPGVTEREAAWEIEKYIREHGGDGLAFPTIVAAGPNGAMAHHSPSDRPLQEGEPIVIDMGAIYQGYCADMTRTICLGAPDERFREVYALVLRAQEAAEAGIRAGMSGIEADRLARQVIEGAGYGEQFGHGLGHAVGLVVHETPRLSALAEDPLPAGATVTVEPGIYLPGWGGVRIEDVVLVKEGGVEVLTQTPKEPLVP